MGETKFYVAKKGDNLNKIATAHGLTLAQVLEWNPEITNPNLIQIGQRIRVSAPESVVGFEPFPGPEFFKPTRTSPIIEAMGYRLIEEGCSSYPGDPDFQWSDADKASYSKWQRKLGFSGKDADGMPGKKSWDKLHVPHVVAGG
ncbi:peptidoglycan-binding protein [Streptomyces sp. Lzd4kr]|uniref:peptidoglycan-binding protein n=1 Tax=Streptomyces chartreusis TaxID=1969 RepID=UPI0022B2D836|nr:peptidoglycan-binding protein [Streptomyces sp. Lzd4kr]